MNLILQVQHRFQASRFVQNHPVDVCQPDFAAFLHRHPTTYLVHDKAVGRILAGSQCCECYAEPAFEFWHLQRMDMSQQYRCLWSDVGVLPYWEDKRSELGVETWDVGKVVAVGARGRGEGVSTVRLGEYGCGAYSDSVSICESGATCDIRRNVCVQVCKGHNHLAWVHDRQTGRCLCHQDSDCVSGRCSNSKRGRLLPFSPPLLSPPWRGLCRQAATGSALCGR